MRKVILAMTVFVFIGACKNDDDQGVELVPPRPLSEVLAENQASIQDYLSTHFYNYEDFETPPANFDYSIVLDTIAGINSDKRPLSEDVQSVTIDVSSDKFGLEDNETVTHTLYYLVAREGTGGQPSPADSTYIKYEGLLLNGDLFDATSDYSWQYLPFFLRGYARGISEFKVGDDIIVNPDGTTEITNSGVGLVILPSGLGYYNGNPIGIPAYSPLIFKINVGLYVADTDYDNDGIPSILEDIDGDGDLTNDNTDQKDELRLRIAAFPNHLDPDDDGDGKLTIDEIIIDALGNITFPDDDNDGIPNYLDPDN